MIKLDRLRDELKPWAGLMELGFRAIAEGKLEAGLKILQAGVVHAPESRFTMPPGKISIQDACVWLAGALDTEIDLAKATDKELLT